jgi:DNA-directed RNA polymerase subunit RPC12/RpoP
MLSFGINLDLDRCPHCSVAKPNLVTAHTLETANSKGSNKRTWRVYVCSKCGGAVLVSKSSGGIHVENMYPSAATVDNTIPNPAFSYLQQANDSIHAPAGAVMLAASSIDAMLKNKGYTNGSLFSRIDKAAEEHLITSDMAKWAHEVRLDANDQRHADLDAQLPDENDAKRIIDFALALGQFLYVLPARVNRGLEGNT